MPVHGPATENFIVAAMRWCESDSNNEDWEEQTARLDDLRGCYNPLLAELNAMGKRDNLAALIARENGLTPDPKFLIISARNKLTSSLAELEDALRELK